MKNETIIAYDKGYKAGKKHTVLIILAIVSTVLLCDKKCRMEKEILKEEK